MEGEKVTNFPVALLISPRYLVLINASMWAFVCACAQVLCVRVSLCAGASWGGLCGFPLFMWQWGVGNGVVVWQTDSFINNVELVFPQRLGSSRSSTWGSWSFGEHLREERIGEPRWGTGGTVTSAISPATLPRERDWRWERKRSTGKGEGGSCRQEDLNTGSIVLCGSLGEDQAEREKRAKIDSCSEVGRWESRWQKRKKEAVREMGGRGRVKKKWWGKNQRPGQKQRRSSLCVTLSLCWGGCDFGPSGSHSFRRHLFLTQRKHPSPFPLYPSSLFYCFSGYRCPQQQMQQISTRRWFTETKHLWLAA